MFLPEQSVLLGILASSFRIGVCCFPLLQALVARRLPVASSRLPGEALFSSFFFVFVASLLYTRK